MTGGHSIELEILGTNHKEVCLSMQSIQCVCRYMAIGNGVGLNTWPEVDCAFREGEGIVKNLVHCLRNSLQSQVVQRLRACSWSLWDADQILVQIMHANLCTDSSLLMSLWRCGSHTAQQYWSIGLTEVVQDTKKFTYRKQAHLGMAPNQTGTSQHTHTIPTSCAVLLTEPTTKFCVC